MEKKCKVRVTKRFMCLLLALALVLTLAPAAVLAQDAPAQQSAAKTVDEVPEGMDVISVPSHTAEDAIPFPLLTTDEGKHALEGVTWNCGAYDAQTPGEYVFTAALPEGYMPPDGQAELSATVTVMEPAGETKQSEPSPVPKKAETGQTSQPLNGIAPPAPETVPVVLAAFNAPDPAAYEIAVGGELPALPETLAATGADGEALTIGGVAWECEAFDAQTPGDYIFTAKLPEGYAAAPEAEAPQITVAVTEPPLAVSAFGAEETVTVTSVYLGDDNGEDKWDNPVYYALDEIHSAADLGLPGSIVGRDEKNQRIEIAGVTWECAAFNADAPGTYTFQLALPAGYAAAGEMTIPTITVVLCNEFAAGGLRYWILTEAPERTAALAGWAGAPQASLKVPAAVSNGGSSYRVTEVVPHAFENDGAIKNLDLSGADNLTEIGAYAFALCGATNPLTIPANVVRIGDSAFEGVYFSTLNLQGAARLTTIGKFAFSGAWTGGVVTIPSGVTSIGSFAFESCERLEALDLSVFRGTLGESVFEGCRKLSAVIFGQAEAPDLPHDTFTEAGWNGGSIHCPKGATGYEKVLGLFSGGWSLDYLDIHTVTVNDAVGGTGWVVSGAAGAAGSRVGLGATPQSGYGFVRWDTEPAVTWLNDTNQYDDGPLFSMPDQDVAVTPVFSLLYSLSGMVSANGSPVRSGLQVTAYNAAGKRVGSAATNADGKYTFSGLTAGTYQVTVMGVTIGDIPYYQTTREFELTDRDKADADVALETGVTQVGFVSAKANGTQNLDTSTQIDLRFDVPVPLTKNCVTLNFNDGGAADVLRLVDEGQLKTDWVLEIGNVVTAANKGYAWGSVTVALPQGYQFTGGALGNLKLFTVNRQLEPPSITAASYDTAVPVVGGAVTVTPGTYTANEAGAEGSHRYAWYRSDRETGLGTPVARTKDYTPTGEDFGKYIWVETTPQGEVTDFWGRPVASPRLRVGVTLTVAVSGAAGGTSPTIDGTAAGSGVVVYGPATVSFTKTAAGDTVKWTAPESDGGSAITGYQVKTGSGGWVDTGSKDTNCTVTSLDNGVKYSFWVRAVNSVGEGAVSGEASTTPKAAEKAALSGSVTIRGTHAFGETLTADTSGLEVTPAGADKGALSYQWKRSNDEIPGAAGASYTLAEGDIGKVINVTVTAANCTGSVTSTNTAIVAKGGQTAPNAPTEKEKTATSVTLVNIPGAEYSRDGGTTWQDSPTFGGLKPNTEYTFYARMKETAALNASPMSGGTAIKTNKTTPTIVDLPTASPLTYGQKLSDSKLEGGKAQGVDGNNLSGAFVWEKPETKPSVGDSSKTPYTIRFVPDDTDNYEAVEYTGVPVTVIKATPTVILPTASPLTYGQKLSGSKLEGGKAQGVDGRNLPGTFAWAEPEIKPSVSDSGKTKYKVKFEPEDSANYETVEKDDMIVTVYPAEGSGNVTMKDWTYGEKANAPDPSSATNGIGNVSYRYKARGAEDSAYSGEKPTQAGSYTVKATFAATDNYTEATATADFKINAAKPAIDTLPTTSPLTDGQKLSDSKLTGGSAKGVDGKDLPGAFVWADPGTKPSVKDSGKTRYTVRFEPGDSANYEAVEYTGVPVTVLAVPPKFTSAGSVSFTEGTGGSHTFTASGTTPITFRIDGALPAGVTLVGPILTVGPTTAAGSYQLSVTAANGTQSNAAQAFTLTVLAAPPASHGPIDPPDPNKPIDLTKDAVFAFSGNYANLAAVRLDGHPLALTATSKTQANLSGYPGYSKVLGDVKSGSVIVTLYKEFLQTLPNGKHTLTVEFLGGSTTSAGDAQFTIEKPEPTPSGQPTTQPTAAPTATATSASPKTGDGQDIALWIVLACAAGACIAGMAVYRGRKRRQP